MKLGKSKFRLFLDKDRNYILWIFDNRCIRCGNKADIIHEILPISHGKMSLLTKNRAPLCNLCHSWAHAVGTNISIPVLQGKRKEFLVRKFLLDDVVVK